MIIFTKCIGWGFIRWPKILYGVLIISALLSSTSIKHFRPTNTITSSKDRQIEPKYFNLAAPENLAIKSRRRRKNVVMDIFNVVIPHSSCAQGLVL